MVTGKFIEVWRQKEAALENSKLTRLLLANSAHEVRTPLNAIINYLEIALEGSLDQETRENLARSHSASKSLIYVINDLLDLTKAEEGQNLIKDEVFDLPACINEATEPFHMDAKRKGIEYHVTKHPGLPQYVHGDGRRVRQALANITANAVAHTHNGSVHVEMFVSEARDGMAFVDFVVSDSGVGMSTGQLDALFRDLEQVSTDESYMPTSQDQKREARTLGLGLAVVARTVRNMDGQLRLKSEEGQGSRFVIQLPFQLPEEIPPDADPEKKAEGGSTFALSAKDVVPAAESIRAAREGEMLLIERGSHINLRTQAEADRLSGGLASAGSRRSVESLGSHGSHGSQKSDVDRLIDAIQTPLALGDNQGEYFMSRSDLKDDSSVPGLGLASAPSGIFGTSATSHRSTSPTSLKHLPPATSPIRSREEPGTANIQDTKTPVRAVKIPDEFTDMPSQGAKKNKSGVLFEVQDKDKQQPTSTKNAPARSQETRLHILVAEDDPINMKILRKRLERAGHTVQHTLNGQECATVHQEKSLDFDAVLMDMQVSAHPSLNLLCSRM